MAHTYEKMTKQTVDFPAYTLCFLGAIMDKLKLYGLIEGKGDKIVKETPSTLIVPIISKKYGYCYDGISLIEKTLKRRGFDCKMEHYKTIDVQEKDGNMTKGYSYEYRISKK